MPATQLTLLAPAPRFHLETLVNPADWLMPRRTNVLSPSVLHAHLAAGAAVSFSLSGGKDGAAAGLAGNRYLDRIGHRGPRACVHTDLGRTEHRESIEMARRLADHLRLPLIVARREKGDLVARFIQRWEDNLARYVELSCVKLIMPWPASGTLFCRSEVKTAPACRAMVQAWPGHIILNVVGIRAEESTARARQPVVKVQDLLESVTMGTFGYNWNAIHHWSLADVLAIHERERFPLAERYTRWNAERLSCRFCVLATEHDWRATLANEESHDHYRELCDLEVASAFGMTERRWLVDMEPELLDAQTRERITDAKSLAARRNAIEATIPQHLLYDKKGWPKGLPTMDEAALLAEVRAEIGALYGLQLACTTAQAVYDRFGYLIEEKAKRTHKKGKGLVTV